MKNKTRAIPIAPLEIPVNPKRAAIIAITKKIAAHTNIITPKGWVGLTPSKYIYKYNL